MEGCRELRGELDRLGREGWKNREMIGKEPMRGRGFGLWKSNRFARRYEIEVLGNVRRFQDKLDFAVQIYPLRVST